jgi:hypothetical protein
MTDETDRPSIDTLLADRARFESWLTQVDAKAGHLPSHIVARVRADYEHRLADVVAALGARADELHAQLTALSERVATLEAALTATQDVRAEDELRALVGEYDDATWATRCAAHDAAIAAADAERRTVAQERDRVRVILVDATRPTPLGTVTVAEPTPVEDAVDAVPDTRVVADVAEEALDLAPIATDAPMHDSALDALSELAAESAAAPAPVEGQGAAPDAPTELFSDPLPQPSFDAGPRRTSRTTSFDEMAFLDSVVGADAAPAGGGASQGAVPAGDAPAAAAGREADPTPDTIRTLKCQECGWLNIPTEWYCEKCGGELSAF